MYVCEEKEKGDFGGVVACLPEKRTCLYMYMYLYLSVYTCVCLCLLYTHACHACEIYQGTHIRMTAYPSEAK